MKKTILAAVTALLVGAGAAAQAAETGPQFVAGQSAFSSNPPVSAAFKARPQTETTVASLAALLADWDRAGFNPPSKPSQYRVYGRNGYVISGPGYNMMVSLLRSAVREADQGRDRAAAAHIAQARGLLTSVAPSTTTVALGKM
jgi:hypothetical protein